MEMIFLPARYVLLSRLHSGGHPRGERGEHHLHQGWALRNLLHHVQQLQQHSTSNEGNTSISGSRRVDGLFVSAGLIACLSSENGDGLSAQLHHGRCRPQLMRRRRQLAMAGGGVWNGPWDGDELLNQQRHVQRRKPDPAVQPQRRLRLPGGEQIRWAQSNQLNLDCDSRSSISIYKVKHCETECRHVQSAPGTNMGP